MTDQENARLLSFPRVAATRGIPRLRPLPCQNRQPPTREGGARGVAAADPSLDAQRLKPSPRRGEGGGRFGHQVRVLIQRTQRAIQKIPASSLRYARRKPRARATSRVTSALR